MGLVEHHAAFVGALREAGVPVSVAESIDAVEAMRHLDLLDRDGFREGIAAALVKRAGHRPAFDLLFDLWYPAATGARADAPAEPAERTGRLAVGDPDAEALRERLRAALLDPDRVAGDRAVRGAARQAVARFGRGPRGGWLSASAIGAVDPGTLMAGLLAAVLGERGDPGRTTLAEQTARARFGAGIAAFEREVQAETRRRRAEEVGRDAVARAAPPPLERIELGAATREQLVELRRAVAPLARRLAARLAHRRRSAPRGRVDFRRTVRASLASGGVPLDVVARPRHPHKPEIVVVCDLSSSVRPFAQFTLLFIAALRQQFTRLRVFGFVDSLDEITEQLAPDAELGDALARVVREARVVRRSGSTDYGEALAALVREHRDALTPATSLLVLGDGRSNYGSSGIEALREAAGAVRHAFWLNPEPRRSWGSGDSEALRYGEVVEMTEVRDLEQLSAFIEQLATA